jgi:hypothetical protein
MNLTGPYIGIVEGNRDPEKLGRIKVSVAHVYGILDSAVGGIGVNDLPWAIPAGLPAGGSDSSGGMDWLPEFGDQVLVFFLDGEPEKPVWMWMMQTLDQAKSLALHDYGTSSETGAPQRGALTRYGHTLEFSAGSVITTTKSGYSISLVNGQPGVNNGVIQVLTPKGHFLEFDDDGEAMTLNVVGDRQETAGKQWLSICESIDFTTTDGDFEATIADAWTANIGTDMSVTAGGSLTEDFGEDYEGTFGRNFDLTVGGAATITAASTMQIKFTTLDLGNSPTEPVVLGNRLLQLFNVLLLWLSGHSHSNGNNGSPTGPPIVPPQPEVQGLLNLILSPYVRTV